jgi:hypothetical protein
VDRYSPAHREYYIIEKFSKSEKARQVVLSVLHTSWRVGIGRSSCGAGAMLLIGSAGTLASWIVGLTPQHPGVVTVCTGRHRDTETPNHRDSPAWAELFAPAQTHCGASGARPSHPLAPKLFGSGAATSMRCVQSLWLGVSVSSSTDCHGDRMLRSKADIPGSRRPSGTDQQ